MKQDLNQEKQNRERAKSEREDYERMCEESVRRGEQDQRFTAQRKKLKLNSMKTKKEPALHKPVSGMCFLRWTKKKPKADRECLLLTAAFITGRWEYALFQILKMEFDGSWYWGIFNVYGDELGDYEDLKADRYYRMKLLGGKNV